MTTAIQPNQSREALLLVIEQLQGRVTQLETALGDIRARQADAYLLRSEQRYRTLVEQIPAVTFTASLDGASNELYVSPAIEKLLGFSQEEWLGNPVLWYSQLHPEDRERWTREFAPVVAGCLLTLPEGDANPLGHLQEMAGGEGVSFRSVYRFIARDGRVVWIHGEAKVVRDEYTGQPLFLQGIAFDITELKNAEELLKSLNRDLEGRVAERTAELSRAVQALAAENVERTKALREKETLLKEIHHRVKNNLQVVTSLLMLQAASLPKGDARLKLQECQQRIHSMARIHESLYRSDSLSRIDLGDYIRRLVGDIVKLYTAASIGQVRVHCDLEPLVVDIDLATSCGLIVNELASNCLKHAFPGGRSGTVRIGLRQVGAEDCLLTVVDDGVGLPAALDKVVSRSLGWRIIDTLVKQIKGTMEVPRREQGTEVRLSFLNRKSEEP